MSANRFHQNQGFISAFLYSLIEIVLIKAVFTEKYLLTDNNHEHQIVSILERFLYVGATIIEPIIAILLTASSVSIRFIYRLQ